VLLTRLPLGIATSFDLHVLGTPPALILSQDQTLHKTLARISPEKLIGAVWARNAPTRLPAVGSPLRPARLGRTGRARSIRTGQKPSRNRRSRVAELLTHSISENEGKQKRGLRRASPAPIRRPTDLCATALLSFQGTNTDARPCSDRITDRTEGACRQSHGRYDNTGPERRQGKIVEPPGDACSTRSPNSPRSIRW
jgi:hypothetical protein